MVPSCASCHGEEVEATDYDTLLCFACGHETATAALARCADKDNRGWMVTETTVNAQNFKAFDILKRMAGSLSLPQDETKAKQAHRVMFEYELGCRVRRAAWCVRRRLCSAGLAIAAKALEDLPRALVAGVATVCGEEQIKEEDCDLAELADRLRRRLDQEWQFDLDASDWIPDHHLPAENLPPLLSTGPAVRSGNDTTATEKKEHPVCVKGGFAALRMTLQQIRDEVLHTSNDNPVCKRACAAIQEKLWQEPAIWLTRQEPVQPVGWPEFDRQCNSFNLDVSYHNKVYDKLLHMATGESMCGKAQCKQSFSWKSPEGTMELVAAAALWSICRRAQHSILLSEMVEKAIHVGSGSRRKESGSWEKDITDVYDDMCALGALKVPPLYIPQLVERSATSLLHSLSPSTLSSMGGGGRTTRGGADGVFLKSVVDVAAALFEEAQFSGYTQGLQV